MVSRSIPSPHIDGWTKEYGLRQTIIPVVAKENVVADGIKRFDLRSFSYAFHTIEDSSAYKKLPRKLDGMSGNGVLES
jgi:hypothetical protein